MPFPTDALPSWLGDYVEALVEAMQVDAGYVGPLALAVVAAAAGGRAVVEVRPDWREPVNLYVAAALESGNRKSTVVQHLVRPLVASERTAADAARAVIVEAETRKRSAEQAARRAAEAASQSLEPDAMDQAIAKAQIAEAITVPTLPRLLADDATPEALASLLAEQSGRIAVISAEGELLPIVAGRYTRGVPQLDVLLKGHSGDELRVDRRGRPPEYVPRPAVTLGLGVQPVVLRDLSRVEGARARGLLARFLYAVPQSLLGRRDVAPAPVPTTATERYDDHIVRLVHTLAEWDDPAVLMLAHDAHELLLEAMADLEPHLGPGGDLHHVADWAGKHIGSIVRLAGLLHLAEAPDTAWSQPITAPTLERALQLGRFLRGHALVAFALMGAHPVVDAARAVLAWLRRRELTEFSVRDVFNANRARFRRARDVSPALTVLTDHGWTRPLPLPPQTGPGRPRSPRYITHPRLHGTSGSR